MSFQRDQGGVTAVLGTIMILGITVMGITAVMFWGGPTLQRIQEQNAQSAMLGEFQEIRRDSLVLSITDSSRVPRINLESGTFGLQAGTRMQVSAMWDPAGTCDFHVNNWGEGVAPQEVGFVTDGCAAVDFTAYRVTGSNLRQVHTTGLAGDGAYLIDLGVVLTAGDWMFELEQGGLPVAQAWLISTHSIFWELHGASSVGLALEGGTVFSSRDGTTFIQEQPPIDEEAFGSTDFVIRLPTYGGTLTEYTGRATASLFLGLVGNHLRVSEDDVHTVRMDFVGPNAQGWCNTLLARNSHLGAGAYAESAGYECDGDGRRALVFGQPAGTTFAFEFIHARITTAL